MAAPPMRNRQFGMSIERSSPKYQFCVMFSVLTTSAVELGYTYRQRLSRLGVHTMQARLHCQS